MTGYLLILNFESLMFVDIACNISSDQFKEEEIYSLVERSKENSTVPIFVGIDYESSIRCINLSKEYNTFCYVGLHPLSSTSNRDDLIKIKSLHNQGIDIDRIIGVGECGLDYYRLEYSSKDIQKEVFLEHLEWNGERYFLHSRDSHRDFMDVLSDYNINGVVHSFTGTVDESKEIIRKGLYIGINGCSIKNEENIEVVKELPLDRLLVETDSPYCKIRRSYSGFKYTTTEFTQPKILKKRNEPCCVKQMVEAVSNIKGIEYDYVVDVLERNSLDFFGKD